MYWKESIDIDDTDIWEKVKTSAENTKYKITLIKKKEIGNTNGNNNNNNATIYDHRATTHLL